MKKDRTEPAGQRSFEHTLRQKMSALHRKPEDRVWQRLDASLGQPGSKRGTAWRTSALVALVTLIGLWAGMLAFRYFQNQIPAQTTPEKSRAATQPPHNPNASTTGQATNPPAHVAPTGSDSPELPPAARTNESVNQNTDQKNTQGSIPVGSSNKTTGVAYAAPENRNTPKTGKQPVTEHVPRNKNNPAAQENGTKTRTRNSGRNSATQGNKPSGKGLKIPDKETTQSIALTLANRPEIAVSRAADGQSTEPAEKQASETTIARVNAVSGKTLPAATDSTKKITGAQPDPMSLPISATDSARADTTSNSGGVLVTAADSVRALPDSATALVPAVAPADSVKKDTVRRSKNRSGLSLTLFGGPARFNQNLYIDERPRAGVGASLGSPNPFSAAAAEFNSHTTRSRSYKTGLLAGWPLRKNLRLESGLGFSKLAMQSEVHYIAAEVVTVDVNGVELSNYQPLITMLLTNPDFEKQYNASLQEQETAYHVNFAYEYLHLPLRLQAHYDLGKWRSFIAAGAEASRLAKSRVTATDAKTEGRNLIPESKGIFREWLWAGTLSGGLGFAVSNHLMLQASADFYRYFSPVVNNPQIRAKDQAPPKFFNFSAGVTYTFRRR